MVDKMSERYYFCGVSEPVPGSRLPEIAEDFMLMVRGEVLMPVYEEVNGEFVEVGTRLEPITPPWSANQELLGYHEEMWPDKDGVLQPVQIPDHGDRFIVHARLMAAEHDMIAYDKQTNPNGYDWIEVAYDGTVTVHAPA